MGCTVAELQQRMTACEFHEWIQYYQLEPFGDEWEQAAEIGYTVAEASGAYKRTDLKRFRSVFKPRFKSRKPKQTPEQQASIFRAFANAHNAAIGHTDG